MSHVVCEICGTSYPLGEDRCPLCGKHRDEADLVVTDEVRGRSSSPEEQEALPKTKGGRFSPKNVERSNREKEVAAAAEAQNLFSRSNGGRPMPPEDDDEYDEEPADPTRRRKIICAVLAVLVAVIGIYILARFISGGRKPDPQPTVPVSTAPVSAEKPCTSVKLDASGIILREVGETYLLKATVLPEDTTDEISYASADEFVAAVNEKGVVTCVGPGETTVTVTCGQVSVECKVVCDVPETEPTVETEPDTKPTEETKPTETEESKPKYDINISDMTLFSKGEEANLDIGNLSNALITWSSDDPSVATVDGYGWVTAVGPGMTYIRARLDTGERFTCIVRCSFAAETEATEPSEETDPSEEPETPGESLSISHTDVTISVGETFTVSISGASGVSWSSGNTGVCSVSGSGAVTGVGAGMTQVTGTVNGKSFSCIVRVK